MDCYLSELFYFITAINFQEMDGNYLIANPKNFGNFAISSNGRLENLLLVHWTGKILCLQLQCAAAVRFIKADKVAAAVKFIKANKVTAAAGC